MWSRTVAAPIAVALALLTGCDLGAEPEEIVAGVRLSESSVSVIEGDSVAITATPLDRWGEPFEGPGEAGSIRWTSADTTIATVRDGVVVGRRRGTTEVSASVGTVVARAEVRVLAPPIVVELWTDRGRLQRDTVFAAPLELLAYGLAGYVASESRVTEVRYTFGSGPERTAEIHPFVPPIASDSGPPLQARFTLELPIPIGDHALTVTVRDEAGNRAVVRRTLGLRAPSRRYAVTYLGTAGGIDAEPADLNEQGQVVGRATLASGATTAVLWSGGGAHDLGAGLGGSSYAQAINDAGQVIGNYTDGCTRAFLWQNGARTAIGGCDVGASAIAADGTVLLSQNRVLIGGEIRPLALPAEARDQGALAYAMNRAGWVLALRYLCGGGACAGDTWVVHTPWESGESTKVSGTTYFADLNENGDVAGSCLGGSVTACGPRLRLADGRSFGADWPPRGSGRFVAINNHRVAIGVTWGVPGDPSSRGFVWEAGSFYRIEPTDPNWIVDRVARINDHGQIAGHAVNRATGQKGVVLLTPVP